MGDSLFMVAQDLEALMGYLGAAYAIGLGVGITTFVMGYGVWFVIDMVRGGL